MATIYDIDDMRDTIERQRIAIEKLLEAIKNSMEQMELCREDDSYAYDLIKDVYMEISSSSTMTGTSEKG